MIAIKKLTWLLIFSSISIQITGQDLSFNIHILSPKSTQPFIMKVSVSGTKVAMQTQQSTDQGQMSFLMDNSTGKQYLLMEGNGQKLAMPVNMNEVDKKSEAVKEPAITYTKETKTIDGYKCSKVITETDSLKADLWITQDIGFEYSEFFKMLNTTKGSAGPVARIPALTNMKGFPVEIISTDKKKNETTTLQIKNISKNKIDPKVFSMEGYQMMDPSMMTR